MDQGEAGFEALGEPPPPALVTARIELHWAAQIAAAAGRALLPAAADDSHMSLAWIEAGRLLAGGALPGARRLAIRPADLALVVTDAAGNAQRELPLAGRTLDQARAWASETLGGDVGQVGPAYDMPAHAVATGGAFHGDDPAARAELGRWFAAGDQLLRASVAGRPEASPVRCWPHHFDLGTLLRQPGPGRTIGAGFSPGDGSYAEPY